MKSFRLMLGAAVAVTSLAIASAASAAPAGVKVGTLTCNVASGMGFVFGSSKDLRCSYEPTKASVEHYAGSISKWGVDIGYTSKAKLIWAVFAPASDVRPGALEGEYAGASAQATVGVGLGERQHGRIAGGDGFDLGVGEFLAADVLGAAGGIVAGDDLADEAGLGFECLPHIGVK